MLLFQLLSGRLPHEHASLGDLLRAVARDPAPDLRTLRPNLSPALAAVVAQALHKQPAQRHADGNRLADELAELQHVRRAPRHRCHGRLANRPAAREAARLPRGRAHGLYDAQ